MKHPERSILLSFDVEEFDMPLEYGHNISLETQMQTGKKGLDAVEKFLQKENTPVTLFTTAHFAEHYPDDIKRLSEKNEIASHTYYHSQFDLTHLHKSKVKLEEITGKPVTGLRMPRMQQVGKLAIGAADYIYDSSLNPTWIPGRYNHLKSSRTMFEEGGVKEIPASVSPNLRIPLFWLAFKNFPLSVYTSLAVKTLKRDGYLNIYFHPWEFTDLKEFKIPAYTKKDSGLNLIVKLHKLVRVLRAEGEFKTFTQFLS
jgi:peptidoglycan/xylan/chitin deacetylase (PgdA/CDA1 family)